MAGRNTQVSRILKIIHLLEINPRGFTVSELTQKIQEYGFTEEDRTVRRDLEAIDSIFPLITEEVEESREKKYKLESVARIAKNVSFSIEELIALYLSREAMNAFKTSPLFQHVTSFYEKLEKVLGHKAMQHLDEFKEKIVYTPMAAWYGAIPQEIFDTIYRAIEEGHVVEVIYTSNNKNAEAKISQRRLGPEGIYFGNAGAYLIAKDLNDNEIKLWSLSRVREAKWTAEEYQAENVDITTFVDGGIGVLQVGDIDEVLIQVTEPMASYVSERRWHKSQNVIRNQEGIALTLKVKINDELARWVLSLGAHAKVIKPVLLREKIAVISEEIAKAYRSLRNI